MLQGIRIDKIGTRDKGTGNSEIPPFTRPEISVLEALPRLGGEFKLIQIQCCWALKLC